MNAAVSTAYAFRSPGRSWKCGVCEKNHPASVPGARVEKGGLSIRVCRANGVCRQSAEEVLAGIEVNVFS